MPGLLDLTDALNLIERSLGLVTSLVHADWRRSAHQTGAAGIAAEALRTLMGANAWVIRIPNDAGWSGTSVEQFLNHYGIVIWNRGVGDRELHFTVEKRQANWAEYLLLRRGIPISGPIFNPRNIPLGARHAPGDRPPAWADRESSGFLDHLLDLF